MYDCIVVTLGNNLRLKVAKNFPMDILDDFSLIIV